MESKQLAKSIVVSLDKHKGEDIRIIGIRELSVIADYFVVASGTSSTHVKSLADYVEFELKEQGITPTRTEGYASSSWILMDYGDVVVHLFTGQTRDFYDLERLWKDGEQLSLSEFLPAGE
ncbi:MAG: ribosome silencing factor [Clostridiales bacterium]|nr:ribosome silencing factor [Clostridiales bacterium]